jgi:spermidine synthase
MAGLLAVPPGAVKASPGLLYEAESRYQYVQVVERSTGARYLHLNEGVAVHSVWRRDHVLTGGVWDTFLAVPSLLGAEPRRVAVLGNAGGTIARAFARFYPRTEIDGVEIDPTVSDVGFRFFGMGDNPRLHVHDADARPFLRATGKRYDLIYIDAYRPPYVPFYLATEEFFELVRDRLAPGGVVIVNAGHPEGSDDLEKVLGRTMAEVFPTVLRDPIEDTNTLLLGSEAPASAETLRDAIDALPKGLRPLATNQAALIGPRLPGGSVYTDDRAPVEWLIDKSIVDYAAGSE